jgi:hypothetical protein
MVAVAWSKLTAQGRGGLRLEGHLAGREVTWLVLACQARADRVLLLLVRGAEIDGERKPTLEVGTAEPTERQRRTVATRCFRKCLAMHEPDAHPSSLRHVFRTCFLP